MFNFKEQNTIFKFINIAGIQLLKPKPWGFPFNQSIEPHCRRQIEAIEGDFSQQEVIEKSQKIEKASSIHRHAQEEFQGVTQPVQQQTRELHPDQYRNRLQLEGEHRAHMKF